MDKTNHTPDPWERDSYETGSTNPPKKRGGIIATLLVIVIFLGGFTRALSILNIRLFANQPGSSSSFLSAHMDTAESCAPDTPSPGFTGETVSALHQRFYQQPAGVLVQQVSPGSSAQSSGIASGDILLRLGGIAVTDTASLDAILRAHKPGDVLQAEFYRAGEQFACTLTLITSD